MHLYLLEIGPLRFKWDCMRSCVVCADGPLEAREIAAKRAGDEGHDHWLNSAKITHIGWAAVADEPRMICRDFLNG